YSSRQVGKDTGIHLRPVSLFKVEQNPLMQRHCQNILTGHDQTARQICRIRPDNRAHRARSRSVVEDWITIGDWAIRHIHPEYIQPVQIKHSAIVHGATQIELHVTGTEVDVELGPEIRNVTIRLIQMRANRTRGISIVRSEVEDGCAVTPRWASIVIARLFPLCAKIRIISDEWNWIIIAIAVIDVSASVYRHQGDILSRDRDGRIRRNVVRAKIL